LLVLFFNSLRWLMGQADLVRTGEPLLVPALEAGPVAVQRPDGTIERVAHAGGTFRYEETTAAGTYRLTGGGQVAQRAVNFLDPVESNLLERVSTWPSTPQGASAARDAARTEHPLAKILALLVLMILVGEWWLYSRKAS
jgi:hypothetical protein